MSAFFSSSIYTGPLAASMKGVDVSFVIGLVVSSVVYVILARKIDLKSEMDLVKAAPLNTYEHS